MIPDYIQDCEFSTPVNSSGGFPSTNQPWQFMHETCTFVATSSSQFIYATTSTSTTERTEVFFGTSTVATTSDIVHTPYVTSGDLMTIYLLMVIIVLQLVYFLASSLSRIRTKKKYLQYGGGDVEQREDL